MTCWRPHGVLPLRAAEWLRVRDRVACSPQERGKASPAGSVPPAGSPQAPLVTVWPETSRWCFLLFQRNTENQVFLFQLF